MSVPSIPYSSTRRSRLHCACRIFLNPRTGPGTRCDFGQKGQTNRVPSAFGVRSTMTDQPGLQSLYSTGSSGTATAFFTTDRTGLLFFTVTRLEGERLMRREVLRLVVRPARVVLVALIACALTEPLYVHRPVSGPVSSGTAFRLTTSSQLPFLTAQTICGARQSAGRCACCSASSSQESGRPRASAGDCP